MFRSTRPYFFPSIIWIFSLAFLSCQGCDGKGQTIHAGEASPVSEVPAARIYLYYDPKAIPAERELYWKQEARRVFGDLRAELEETLKPSRFGELEGFYVEAGPEAIARMTGQATSPREFGAREIYIVHAEPAQKENGESDGPVEGGPGPLFKDPAGPWPCRMNADCVVYQPDCCGCSEGGAVVARSREQVRALAWSAARDCEDAYCPQVISNHISCHSEAVCRDGLCDLQPDREKICRSRRYFAYCDGLGKDKSPEAQKADLGLACGELWALCRDDY